LPPKIEFFFEKNGGISDGLDRGEERRWGVKIIGAQVDNLGWLVSYFASSALKER